jgi:hypothetical protein
MAGTGKQGDLQHGGILSGSVREVLQISLRQGGHGRLAVFDVAISDQEPCHDQDRE